VAQKGDFVALKEPALEIASDLEKTGPTVFLLDAATREELAAIVLYSLSVFF
jgi:hypothetical protein